MNKIKGYIHLIATDKDSNILKVVTDLMVHRNRIDDSIELHDSPHPKSDYFQPYHLYIITDEEIKEDDWCLGSQSSVLKVPKLWIRSGDWRKIVATTNPELWDRTANPDKNKFITNTNIYKIPQIFIEDYIKSYNSGIGVINEVWLEIEFTQTTKQKYYQYFGNHQSNLNYITQLKLTNNGEVILHPIKERMYSREEMGEAIRMARETIREGNWKYPMESDIIDKNY